MQYLYEASDPAGRAVLGKLDCASEEAARDLLLQMGFRPLSLAPVTQAQPPTAAPVSEPTQYAVMPAGADLQQISPAEQQEEEEEVLIGRPTRAAAVGYASALPAQAAVQNKVGTINLTGNAAKSLKRTTLKPAPAPTTSAQYTLVPPNASKLAGVSTRDLMFFFRQLASLIQSGITLYNALNNLAARTPNKHLRQAASEMAQAAHDGRSVSSVMLNYPRIFPEHISATVLSGETGGFVDIALGEVATSFEENIALYKFTWIPKFMAVQAWYSLVFAIPLFPDLFSQFNIQQGLIHYAWQCLTVCLPIAVGGHLLAIWIGRRLRLPEYKQKVDALALKVPPFGTLQKEAALNTFLRVIRRLYNAGIQPTQAWECAMHTPANLVVRNKLRSAYQQIQTGMPLPDAMQSTGLFDSEVEQLIFTGHESGQLVEMLDQATNYYQDLTLRSLGKARFMMFRYGVLAMLLLGGAALIIMTKTYYQGMFDYVNKYFAP